MKWMSFTFIGFCLFGLRLRLLVSLSTCGESQFGKTGGSGKGNFIGSENRNGKYGLLCRMIEQTGEADSVSITKSMLGPEQTSRLILGRRREKEIRTLVRGRGTPVG